MTVDDVARPEWALRVGGDECLGTGVALSPGLALTSERVVRGLAFVDVRTLDRGTLRCNVVDPDRELDVALLEPASPDASFPDNAVLVPRALWRGARLAENRAVIAMWMHEPDAPRTLTIRLRRTAERGRRVRFRTHGLRKGAHRGSRGGPVVEASGETAPRLLGIVGACDMHSIDALSETGSGWLVPMERIADRYEAVARWVETPAERSPAWERHWEPRSRGVVQAYERGCFFTGRREACATLCRRLEERPDLTIVTGRQGSGKSAVLARLVVLSCPRYLTLLGSEAEQVVDGFPRLSRPVDAAVYAHGLTASEVVSEIADQLGVGGGSSAETPPELELERGVVIVVDAVDEAHDPTALMREVAIPAAQSGAAMAIGASAPAVFSDAPAWAEWVDLDQEDSPGAVADYVAKRLATRSGYGAEASQEVAGAVSHASEGLFVVAEMITRTLTDRDPIDTGIAGWQSQLPSDPVEALRGYLARFGSEQARVLAVLHPLAFARGAGLTISADGTWLMAANRLRPDELDALDEDDLRRVCEQAHDYVVTGPHGERRLYHDGIADAVRAIGRRGAQVPDVASARFADALLSLLPEDPDAAADAYADVDGYLLRHLPGHLADAGRTAELLRPGLLLAANQEALRRALVLGALAVPSSDEADRVAVVHALAWPQPTLAQRAASLCLALRRQEQKGMAQRVERALGGPERTLPYELISAPPLPPVLAEVDGFGEVTRSFDLVAVVSHGGASLIVCGGRYAPLQSWWLDGTPGPLERPDAHSGDPSVASGITALTVFEYGGEPLVVTGGEDRAVWSWRLDGSPGPFEQPEAHSGAITALAVVDYDGEPLIISGGDDRVLRSWRLNGRPGPLQQPYSHERAITALAVVDHHGDALIVSAGDDGALRSWRLDRSRGPLQQPEAHAVGVEALEVVHEGGEPLIVSSGGWTLRSWRLDGHPGPLKQSEEHRGAIGVLAVGDHGGAPLIISGFDHALRSWRLDGTPGPLQQPDAHSDSISALAVIEHAGEPIVVSGGSRTLRSWRLHALADPRERSEFHRDSISALAVVDCGGEPQILSGGHGEALRSWRLDGTPGPLQQPAAHELFVSAVAAIDDGGEPLIISGGHGGLRSWRLDGFPGPLEHHDEEDSIAELTVVDWGGEPLIVSGSLDGALRSWRLDGGPGPLQQPDAHDRYISSLAVVEDGGESLIVSCGEDGVVRTWRLDGGPAPLRQHNANAGAIQSLVVVEHGDEPLLIVGGWGGALLSYRLDGSPGPLQHFDSGDSIQALAVLRHRGEPLIVSGSREQVLRTWRLDGTFGPLLPADAHRGSITALTVVENGREPLIVSGGSEGTIVRHVAPAMT